MFQFTVIVILFYIWSYVPQLLYYEFLFTKLTVVPLTGGVIVFVKIL